MTFTTGAQLDAATLKNIAKAGALSFGPGSVVLGGSQGLDFILAGTNFGNFDARGIPHSGTLTSFEVVRADRIVDNFVGINMPVADFFADAKAGNADLLNSVIFSGDDKLDIVGSINGAPPAVFNGYTGNDVFHLNLSLHGAAAILNGGPGDDIFNLDRNFDAATDKVDGGTGFDIVTLSGGSAADLTMGATSMVNVERIVLATGSSYTITMNDGNVASGQVLQVDASAVQSIYPVVFNGAAEKDGAFDVTGGMSNDTLIGGRGADTLSGGNGVNPFTGNDGADQLTGGQGADHFVFESGFGHDVITDFTATGGAHDVIQFSAADFTSFADLQGHMAQAGADVVITLDAGDSLVLQHVTLSSLSAADFLFA